MRPIEWSAGAIRQNILPPTLNTATPTHCTVRVAAGRLAQNLSICRGVMRRPYTAAAAHAKVGHDRVARRQAEPPPAVPAGARRDPDGAPPVVRRPGVHRGRDADPADRAGRRSASHRLRHRVEDAGWPCAAALAADLARIRD